MVKAEIPAGRLSPLRVETAHWTMLLLVLALAAIGMLGERVPASDGLGWDGTIYARMVRELGAMITGGDLSPYHAQRILPAIAVKAMLAFTGLAPTDEAIIRAFSLYNLVLLLVSCLLWRAIADTYRLGIAGRWVGFCGMFLSFAVAKLIFYYPILTDTSALAFGLLTLLLYIRDRPLPLALASIVGAFCWPTLSLCGALLLLFPRNEEPAEPAPSPRLQLPVFACLGISFACVALYLAMLATPDTSCRVVESAITSATERLGSIGQSLRGSASLDEPCATMRQFLTAVPSVLGLALALAMLLLPFVSFAEIRRHLGRLRPLRILYAVLVLAVPVVIVRLIADPTAPSPSSLKYIARIILLPAEGKFLMPLVGTFVYWGPLVLVAALFWREATQAARRIGLGAALTIAMTLLFGLVGEARFLTAAWPFMVLSIALVLDRRPLGRSFWITFLVITVAFAQFWLPLNIGPWEGGPLDRLLEFPKQMYFMHFGPWMNWTTFVVQFVLMAIAAVWIAATLRRGQAS